MNPTEFPKLKFCSTCGSQNGSSAQFCTKCGLSFVGKSEVQTRHCTKCGTLLESGVMYCPTCGRSTQLQPTEQLIRVPVPPEPIRQELGKFTNFRNVSCMMCGYTGLMGVRRTVDPWYTSTPVIIILCLTGIGIIAAVVIGVTAGLQRRYEVECPLCHQILLSK